MMNIALLLHFHFFFHFSHSWETVAQAAWRKYPNPMNPAVIGTDVVERKVVDGVLHTHRLVSSKWYFPKWAQAVSVQNQFFSWVYLNIYVVVIKQSSRFQVVYQLKIVFLCFSIQ